MNAILRIEAIESNRNLKARYVRCIDCQLWDELSSVFTQGMTVVTPTGDIYLEGGANYAASLKRSLETSVSRHQGLTAEIEIFGEDEAKAI